MEGPFPMGVLCVAVKPSAVLLQLALWAWFLSRLPGLGAGYRREVLRQFHARTGYYYFQREVLWVCIGQNWP
jgi:hypothetical protein